MSRYAVRDPRALTLLRTRPASVSSDERVAFSEHAIGVIVCPDAPSGRLSSWDRRTLGTARRLADIATGDVLVVARQELSDDAGIAGADALTVLDPHLSTEHLVDVVCDLLTQYNAKHVIFPDSDVGGDAGRRVAARIHERANTRVWRIRNNRATCLTGWDGGEYERDLSRVLMVADGAESPYVGNARRVRIVPANDTVCLSPAQTHVSKEWRLSVDEVDLQDAELVVGGGLGVRSWASLKKVAGTLGASFGASRPVIDQGTLPRPFQIGATGALLKARCYIALGISGAPQHLEGIKQCDFVIGVNVDSDCALSRRADLFIQADAGEVLEKLGQLTRGNT